MVSWLLVFFGGGSTTAKTLIELCFLSAIFSRPTTYDSTRVPNSHIRSLAIAPYSALPTPALYCFATGKWTAPIMAKASAPKVSCPGRSGALPRTSGLLFPASQKVPGLHCVAYIDQATVTETSTALVGRRQSVTHRH